MKHKLHIFDREYWYLGSFDLFEWVLGDFLTEFLIFHSDLIFGGMTCHQLLNTTHLKRLLRRLEKTLMGVAEFELVAWLIVYFEVVFDTLKRLLCPFGKENVFSSPGSSHQRTSFRTTYLSLDSQYLDSCYSPY